MIQWLCLCHWRGSEVDLVESAQVVPFSEKRKPDSPESQWTETSPLCWLISYKKATSLCRMFCAHRGSSNFYGWHPRPFIFTSCFWLHTHRSHSLIHTLVLNFIWRVFKICTLLHRVCLEKRPLASMCLKFPMIPVRIWRGDFTLWLLLIPCCYPSLSCPAFSEDMVIIFLLCLTPTSPDECLLNVVLPPRCLFFTWIFVQFIFITFVQLCSHIFLADCRLRR